MKKIFGTIPSGKNTWLYTISCGGITAEVTDLGATLVRLLVPDANGRQEDVVLGYDDAAGYLEGDCFFGATVGRNANRIAGAAFRLNDKEYTMTANENGNNLHSGLNFYHTRLWTLENHTENAVTLSLNSPHGDQGFPGNAVIKVTYMLDAAGGLHIIYDGVCDQDTIFNLTNHSYFNLAGHQNTDKAVHQIMTIPGRFFNPDDAESIPTGELRPVAGSPMDFRAPKPISQDIEAAYEPLELQGGYDHNWEVFCNPCAILKDPGSGRSMAVYTDCPGVQFYSGNFVKGSGKAGVVYGKRTGICLETQYYPDCIHHSDWPQPVTKAGEKYHSETIYRFCAE